MQDSEQYPITEDSLEEGEVGRVSFLDDFRSLIKEFSNLARNPETQDKATETYFIVALLVASLPRSEWGDSIEEVMIKFPFMKDIISIDRQGALHYLLNVGAVVVETKSNYIIRKSLVEADSFIDENGAKNKRLDNNGLPHKIAKKV